jgi:hypothetical protein
MFWGNGTILTETGSQLLKDLSLLLAAISNKVVVSEYATSPDMQSKANGLWRAWAVANYISGQKDIPLHRFAISDKGIIPIDQLPLDMRNAQRVLEIVVLERAMAR